MSERIDLLLKKKELSLREHLEQAIANGQVRNRYQPSAPRKRRESVAAYVRRLVKNAAHPQFVQVVSGSQNNYIWFGVCGPLVTPQGVFTFVPAQIVGGKWGVHYILLHPDLETLRHKKEIMLRMDSGCISGQLFDDQTCDCREQLELSRRLCVEKGAGIIINIPNHDGRGWGEYKMANQQIMHELGVDTVRAARLFYGNDIIVDQRTYVEAVIILRALGFDSHHTFELATNNPRKIGEFTAFGMNGTTMRAVIPQKLNLMLKKNLQAKAKNWKHSLSV